MSSPPRPPLRRSDNIAITPPRSRELGVYNKTRALCIGNNYAGSNNQLNGCVNDAKNISHYLGECKAVAQENVTLLLEATRKQILDGFHTLALQALEENLDWVFISYSGHGSKKACTTFDEDDGYDEVICPVDFCTAGTISDDELHKCLDSFPDSCAITLLMDCCHSGSICDLGYNCSTVTRQTPDSLHGRSCGSTALMISGCTDKQTSADAYDNIEKEMSGALSCALIYTLRYSPETRSDVFVLIEAMRKRMLQQGFSQLPQLSSSKILKENTRYIPHQDLVHTIPSPKRNRN